MRFSIIIPTFDRRTRLDRCLRSLTSLDYPSERFEIIIVDDGSTDGTCDLASSWKGSLPNLVYHRISHQGCAAARNKGIEISRGEILAFIDDDCEVPGDWLKKIDSAFTDPSVDGLTGSILPPVHQYVARAQYLLNSSSFMDQRKKTRTAFLPASNAAYRRSAIEMHKFPVLPTGHGYTDVLFSQKLHSEGKKLWYVPAIGVWHSADHTLRDYFGRQRKAAKGFFSEGYKLHGKLGRILRSMPIISLFCPRLALVASRCARQGLFLQFILHLPLLAAGEFYRGLLMVRYSLAPPQN